MPLSPAEKQARYRARRDGRPLPHEDRLEAVDPHRAVQQAIAAIDAAIAVVARTHASRRRAGVAEIAVSPADVAPGRTIGVDDGAEGVRRDALGSEEV